MRRLADLGRFAARFGVVPRGTVVKFVGSVFENGELHAKTTVASGATPGSQTVPKKGSFSTLAAPSDSETFERAGGLRCLERKQNSTAHYDPCQWKLSNDKNPNADFYASEMHGTGKSHSVWTLSGLEVASRRTERRAPPPRKGHRRARRPLRDRGPDLQGQAVLQGHPRRVLVGVEVPC